MESLRLEESLAAAYPLVDMPDDFIPTLKTLKPTDSDKTPLEDRFQHLKSLDKRPPSEHGQPIAGINLDDFKERIDSLR